MPHGGVELTMVFFVARQASVQAHRTGLEGGRPEHREQGQQFLRKIGLELTASESGAGPGRVGAAGRAAALR